MFSKTKITSSLQKNLCFNFFVQYTDHYFILNFPIVVGFNSCSHVNHGIKKRMINNGIRERTNNYHDST